MRPQQLLNLLNRLGHPTKTKWNVRIMERYRHGAGVVTYLARYLRGGPIKNARLVAYDGDRVTFTYRARQEEADAGPASPQRMTLPVADFLQRWLLHVPVPQTRVVRCLRAVPSKPRRGPRRLPHGAWATAPGGPPVSGLADGVCAAWGGPSRAVSHLWPAARVHGRHPAGRGSSPPMPQRSAPHEIRTTGEPDQGRRVPGDSQGTHTTAWRQYSRAVAAPGTAIAPAREGPAKPVPDRMTEGGPTVTSIARGGKNLVRPHQGAVSPTKCYPKCSGPGVRPPRGSLP